MCNCVRQKWGHAIFHSKLEQKTEGIMCNNLDATIAIHFVLQVSGFSVKFSENLLVNHACTHKVQTAVWIGKTDLEKRLRALKKLGRQNTLKILCMNLISCTLIGNNKTYWKISSKMTLYPALKSLNWDEKLFSISTFSVSKTIACLKPTT